MNLVPPRVGDTVRISDPFLPGSCPVGKLLAWTVIQRQDGQLQTLALIDLGDSGAYVLFPGQTQKTYIRVITVDSEIVVPA